MEKITFNNHHRPKSAKNCQYSLTESNNNSLKRTKYNLPFLRDKIEKKYFLKTRTKQRNFPEYSRGTFFKSSTPFNFIRNKNNKNEFFVCYNGGPVKKFNLAPKKIHLNLDNSNIYSDIMKYRLKSKNFLTTNNEKEKLKYNYLYNHLEEEKNKDEFINTNETAYKLKNPDINVTEVENSKENRNEKEEEEKGKKNFFKIKKKRNFLKIQIHNNCKPFLVDDYRYYAEKFL